MGVSDDFLKPRYRMYLRNNLKSFNNLKIAWLGQQDPKDPSMTNIEMFKSLKSLFLNCEHHFFDIENQNKWDVHNDWGIKNYDLVLCLRLTYLVQSSSHLIKQIRKTVQSNKVFVSDFVSGNIKDNTMSWKTNNLVCYLPSFYNQVGLKYSVTDPDHLLTKQMFDDHKIKITDYVSFKDPKGRYYIISKVNEQ